MKGAYRHLCSGGATPSFPLGGGATTARERGFFLLMLLEYVALPAAVTTWLGALPFSEFERLVPSISVDGAKCIHRQRLLLGVTTFACGQFFR